MIFYRKVIVSNIPIPHGIWAIFIRFSWYWIIFSLDPDPYQSSVWIRIRINMIRIRHTGSERIIYYEKTEERLMTRITTHLQFSAPPSPCSARIRDSVAATVQRPGAGWSRAGVWLCCCPTHHHPRRPTVTVHCRSDHRRRGWLRPGPASWRPVWGCWPRTARAGHWSAVPGWRWSSWAGSRAAGAGCSAGPPGGPGRRPAGRTGPPGGRIAGRSQWPGPGRSSRGWGRCCSDYPSLKSYVWLV